MSQPEVRGITDDGTQVGPDPRRWIALALIAAAQLLVVLDASVVNIALPSAQQALGMSDTSKQWVVTGYSLTFGGFLLFGGRLADLRGRKRIFIVGLAGFAVASAVGGLASGPEMLLVARAAQGLFAALLAPAGLALLATAFTDPVERGKAFGIFGAAVGTGGVVGMVLGGVLTELGSWRWCLLVNLPVVLIILIPAVRLLSESRASGPTRYDLPGAITATLGVGSLIYGVSQAGSAGWLSGPTVGFGAAGLVLLVVFVLIERRSAQPMMPLRIVLDRVRGGGYLIVLLIGAALYSLYLFLTYYLQVVLNYSALATGFAFVPIGVGILVGSLGAGKVLARMNPRWIVVVGLALGAAGIAWLSVLDPTTGFWPVVFPMQIVVGLGIGAAMTTVISVTLDRVSPDETGVASALTNAMREIGGAAGISALNVVAISVTAAQVGVTREAALTSGYVAAFGTGAGLLVVAVLIALLATRSTRAKAE